MQPIGSVKVQLGPSNIFEKDPEAPSCSPFFGGHLPNPRMMGYPNVFLAQNLVGGSAAIVKLLI